LLEERTVPTGLFSDPIVTTFAAGGTGADIALATGHFVNNDSRLDVVAVSGPAFNGATPSEMTFNVFASAGQGSLIAIGSPVHTGVAGSPRLVVAGDFNGDGNLDLAMTYDAFGSADPMDVAVWFGDGNGGFSEAPGFPRADDNALGSIAAGNFNGHLGLAWVGLSSVNVLLGDGAGNFTFTSFSPGLSNPTSVLAGDFDGDGRADLAVVGSDSKAMAVFLGDGQGNFPGSPKIHNFTFAPGFHTLTMGEFDGDTIPDLAVADNRVVALEGDGAGGFAEQSPFSLSAFPNDAVVADFDGNNSSDLFVATPSTTAQVLLSDGNNRFTDGGAVNARSRNQDSYPLLQAGDFTNDGKPDVVLVDSSGNLDVLLNQSQASKTDTSTSLQSSGSPSVLGERVTFTATVTPVGSSTHMPSGSVTFMDGNSTLSSAPLQGNGQAVYTTSDALPLSQGMRSITAVYNGDANFNGSQSPALAQDVQDPTSTQLGLSSNPLVKGQPLTLTATITPALASALAPGGTVRFRIHSGLTGQTYTANVVNGQAQVTLIPSILLSSASVTAIYSGDDNFAGSALPAQTLLIRAAKTFTWSGLGSDNLWTDGANWVGGVAPSPGDRLVFPSDAAQLTNVNDFPSGSQFSLTFAPAKGGGARADFNVGGAPITLGAEGIIDHWPATGLPRAVVLSVDFVLGGQAGFVSIQGSDSLFLKGRISDGSGSAAGLLKSGQGTLHVDNSNRYLGPTEVAEGVVIANHADALGSGAVSVRAGATLRIGGSAAQANALALAGTLFNAGSGDSWTGPIALSGSSAVVQVSASSTGDVAPLTLSGTITGNAALRKTGSGTVILSGQNAYTGMTLIQQGTVSVRDPAGLGSRSGAAVVFAGATLELFGGITVAKPLTLRSATAHLRSAGGDNIFSGSITMNGKDPIDVADGHLTITGRMGFDVHVAGITKAGAGTLVLPSPNNLDVGSEVAGGVVVLRDANALGGARGGTIRVDDGATVALDAGSASGLDFTQPLQLTGSGFSNQGALRNLNGANRWEGDIQLTGVTFIGADATTKLTVYRLSGDTLAKVGSGRLRLSAVNTYTGGTLVMQGTLWVDNEGALCPAGNGTTVYAGASLQVQPKFMWDFTQPLTLLDGSNLSGGGGRWTGLVIVAGKVTVSCGADITLDGFVSGTNGATLVKSGAGSLLLEDIEQTGSTFAAVVGPSSQNQIVVTDGALELSSLGTNAENLSVTLATGLVPTIGQQFTLIDNQTTRAIDGTFAGLAEATTFQVDGLTFQITYKGGDGNDVVVTRTA
jgi:autotransporter-associated beta strand protein